MFDGIDLEAAIQRLQSSLSEKTPVKKGPTRSESPSSVSQHAATLVLEAIYLKAKSLQKLDKFTGIVLTIESYSLPVVYVFFLLFLNGNESSIPPTSLIFNIYKNNIPLHGLHDTIASLKTKF